MNQNISSAVMQRRYEPLSSLDDFPTPPWATRALCVWMEQNGYIIKTFTVAEPACNRGHMVKPLSEYFDSVLASDIHDYGHGYPVQDYLFGNVQMVDWTITNPPFKLAQEFIERGMQNSRHGVAVIVRTAFLESKGRYNMLFKMKPPSDILQFSERVVMHKGRLTKTGTTATSYCWLVWGRYNGKTAFHWIPPCRKELEKPEDYGEK